MQIWRRTGDIQFVIRFASQCSRTSPHPLPSSPYCIVKKSSTTPLSTRREIYKREIKYSIPLLRSLSLVTDLHRRHNLVWVVLMLHSISVSLRNCKFAPVAFSLNNFVPAVLPPLWLFIAARVSDIHDGL